MRIKSDTFPATLGLWIALAAVYFGTARLGLVFAIPPGNATSVWPPSGIAFVALLLFGYRVWPGVFFGSLFANLTTEVSVVVAASMGVGNTLEAIAGVWLTRRVVGGRLPCSSARNVFRFGAIAALVSTLGAFVGAGSLVAGGSATAAQFFPNWLTWWLGDTAGILQVVPLVLAWTRPREAYEGSRKELLLLASVSLAITLWIFAPWRSQHLSDDFLYLVLIPPVWAALRFGRREVTALTALLATASIVATSRGLDPFRGEGSASAMLSLQAFLIVTSFTGMSLVGVVSSRRALEKQLRESQEDLEVRIQERTADLRKANEELQEQILRRSETEQALRASEERFRLMVQNSSDIFVMVDAQGRQRYVSDAASTITGYSTEELTQQTVFDCVHPDDLPRLREVFEGAIAHPDEVARIEFRHAVKSGGYVELEAFGQNRIADPHIGAIVVTTRDITQRKNVQRELERAREAAEEASRAKSRFVANTSHEIRTPLNGIIGMANLLLDTSLTDEQRSYLHAIHVSSEHLLSLLQGVLDISRIEAGKLELDCKPFDPRELARNVVAAVSGTALEKGLCVDLEIDGAVPDRLSGDEQRLRQVLINVLGNAVKFTDKGRVAMSISAESFSGGRARILIEVQDTGIGIPSDRLRDVFEPFVQADSSSTRRYGGSGLGLAISRELTALMGGQLEARSEAGTGTCFTVRVPLPVVTTSVVFKAPQPRPAPAPKASRQLRILLADDNRVNQRVTTVFLEKQGHQVVVADNGRAAVEAFQKDRFDLVLMDVQMPDLDGLEATAMIRSIEGESSQKRVPIIALTAHATTEDEQRCREAAMDGFLTKPVRPAQLLEAIGSLS